MIENKFVDVLNRISVLHDACKSEQNNSHQEIFLDRCICLDKLWNEHIHDLSAAINNGLSPKEAKLASDICDRLLCSLHHLHIAQRRLGIDNKIINAIIEYNYY